LGIVKAPQLAIVNAETVVPKVQNTFLYRAVGGGGRSGIAAGVGNRAAFDAVAAERLA
jgi:hypothetical protein